MLINFNYGEANQIRVDSQWIDQKLDLLILI